MQSSIRRDNLLSSFMLFRKFAAIIIAISTLHGAVAQDIIPSYIITAGKLPQLAYSTGEDRLGSAKMGYIDTFVVMKVLDTVKDLYKVRLSSSRYAFIEKT